MSTGRWPDAHSGLTTRDLSNDGVNPNSAPDLIVAILLGPLAEARGGWPIEWPLDKNAANEDARQLHLLADFHDLKATACPSGPAHRQKRGVQVLGSSAIPGMTRWRTSSQPIPIRYDRPRLEVQDRLNVHDNAVAKQVHRLMKERRLTGWSIGYTLPEGVQARRNGVNEVSE